MYQTLLFGRDTSAYSAAAKKRWANGDKARLVSLAAAGRKSARLRKKRPEDKPYGYGITRGEYAAMLTAQGGTCWLCGAPPKVKKLSVDHDHKSGKVRGLLCPSCNFTLGWIERVGIQNVVRYLGGA